MMICEYTGPGIEYEPGMGALTCSMLNIPSDEDGIQVSCVLCIGIYGVMQGASLVKLTRVHNEHHANKWVRGTDSISQQSFNGSLTQKMTVPLNENLTGEGTGGECRALVLFNDYNVTRDEQGGPCLDGL